MPGRLPSSKSMGRGEEKLRQQETALSAALLHCLPQDCQPSLMQSLLRLTGTHTLGAWNKTPTEDVLATWVPFHGAAWAGKPAKCEITSASETTLQIPFPKFSFLYLIAIEY